MKIDALHIGMRVRHPQHGLGSVHALTQHAAEIRFDDGLLRTVSPEASDLRPAEAQAVLNGLDLPLGQLIERVVEQTATRLGVEKPDAVVPALAARWRGGKFVLHASDPTLATKEVELEVFFHKIVMVRNQLRVLEQRVNAHEQLTDADKVDLQQYITRCYGSLTTFNLLFKDRGDQFST
jgi:hypothetical protein